MNQLPPEVVLFVVDMFLSMYGDFDAMQVCRAVNKQFKTTYDWHVFSDLLDYMARNLILISDSLHRNADGMVQYECDYRPLPDDWE